MPRRRPGLVTASPSSLIVPLLGVSSPPAIRISVVLPQPDGPRKTTSELRSIASEASDTTGTGPKDFVTRSN